VSFAQGQVFTFLVQRGERGCVCQRKRRERERMCVYVRERGERERECVCMSEKEERDRENVCVCQRKRKERERERESECYKGSETGWKVNKIDFYLSSSKIISLSLSLFPFFHPWIDP